MKRTKTYEISSFKALSEEGPGKFQAVVSVFGNVDLQGDRVMPGAFQKSIGEWREKGDPIPVIWSHDWLNPDAHIGFVDPKDAVEISGDQKSGIGGGLLVKGTLDVHKPFASQVFDLLKERRVKEWSFAYDIIKERTADDGANELIQLDVLEVGPCLKGANPETYTVSAKSAIEADLKEAFDAQKALTRFIDMIKTVEDPEIARMLTKTVIGGPSEKIGFGRFHIEIRTPQYDGKYSLEGPDVYACVSNKDGVEVDTHDSEQAARTHVALLEKGDEASLTDDEIRKAVGLEPLAVEEKSEELEVAEAVSEVVEAGEVSAEESSSAEEVTVSPDDSEKSETTGVPGSNVHVHETTGDFGGSSHTWVSFTSDGTLPEVKTGRVIGASAASQLKQALTAAVDDFVKSVNGGDEKSDEPEAVAELEEINSRLDELLGEEK